MFKLYRYSENTVFVQKDCMDAYFWMPSRYLAPYRVEYINI